MKKTTQTENLQEHRMVFTINGIYKIFIKVMYMIFAKGIAESEVEKDEAFHLNTNGRHDKCSDNERAPYEPTLYSVLEDITESRIIASNDRIIDFGSGKGRATIFLSATNNCEAIGIEFVEELHFAAIDNANNTCLQHKASFINTLAEDYFVDKKDSCFYFANPFSVSVLKKVLENIYFSLQMYPRKVKLLFHYMSKEYLDFLSTEQRLKHTITIDCRQHFCADTGKENVMVYEILPLEGIK